MIAAIIALSVTTLLFLATSLILLSANADLREQIRNIKRNIDN